MGIRFVVHEGLNELAGASDVLIQQRVTNSRLTVALLSPDFLASEWMDRYDQINAWLRSVGQRIIPVLLRKCEWKGGQPIPRDGAIGRVGNDAAWTEISKEIRKVFGDYYPNEMPRPQSKQWQAV